MKVTINSFSKLLRDLNREELPIPGDYVSTQTMTAVGTCTAMPAGVIGVEVVTDTAITINGYGGSSSRLMPANSVAYFPAVEGQTFTTVAA